MEVPTGAGQRGHPGGDCGDRAPRLFGDQPAALELPHSLRYIGFGAFANCIRLTKVEIPDGLEIVETTAFSGCTSLTRVTIPASVTQIGDRAFQDCPKLTIHAPAGSCAEQYAKDHNIPFQAL